MLYRMLDVMSLVHVPRFLTSPTACSFAFNIYAQQVSCLVLLQRRFAPHELEWLMSKGKAGVGSEDEEGEEHSESEEERQDREENGFPAISDTNSFHSRLSPDARHSTQPINHHTLALQHHHGT